MEISISLDPAVDRDLEAYVAEAGALGEVSIHCDVMDGRYVEREAMNGRQLKNVLKVANKPVDVHFMVRDVAHWLDETPRAKSLRSITFQIEPLLEFDIEKAHILLERIRRERGVAAGIAIDLHTEVARVPVDLIRASDVITLMSVNAGKSGQAFNPNAVLKIKQIREVNPGVRLILDGGINEGNIALVKIAGVDIAAVGSAIYNAENRAAAITKLL